MKKAPFIISLLQKHANASLFFKNGDKLHWRNQCHLREMINDWTRRRHVRLGNVHRWRCMRADSRKDFISEGLWLFDWQKDPTDSISTAWRSFRIPFLFIVEEERLYFIRLLNIELWHYVGKNLRFYLENLNVICLPWEICVNFPRFFLDFLWVFLCLVSKKKGTHQTTTTTTTTTHFYSLKNMPMLSKSMRVGETNVTCARCRGRVVACWRS